ncbi:ada2a-containing complex component 1 [Rhipicephalus microplus]|uniref:ada2a-containing complex component 1 n=1 Tax=Rhipicephalus microplus TaxID=6941 RepID=UPI003F6AD125
MEVGSEKQPLPSTSSAECGANDSNNGDSSSQAASEAMEPLWLSDMGVAGTQEIEDPDEIGEFFFESDHLALRGSVDYRNTLKTLAVLEAQRVQVIQDIEKLIEVRENALADPIRFVERLQKKEDLGIPLPQLVAPLPNIDWSQYSLTGIQRGIEKKRQLTRHAAKAEQRNAQSSNSQGQGGSILIRGRVFNESKPATFNQLWTAEEQKQLEDLLIKFPPEEVESRRWEKIAYALGNRTPTQVASRVQKYFIKLAKAGLPVPGKLRTVIPPRKTSSRRGHHRHGPQGSSSYMFSHSTFFASRRPPVFMSEADDESSVSSWSYLETTNGSQDKSEAARVENDDEDDVQVDAAVKESPEYQELIALQKAREERVKRTGLAQHVGFRCDRCECEPIVGTRWHCTDCPANASIDFCSDCVDCMHETATHKEDHHLEAIRVAQDSSTFHDRDYMSFTGADYNYLDPNYLPGSS